MALGNAGRCLPDLLMHANHVLVELMSIRCTPALMRSWVANFLGLSMPWHVRWWSIDPVAFLQILQLVEEFLESLLSTASFRWSSLCWVFSSVGLVIPPVPRLGQTSFLKSMVLGDSIPFNLSSHFGRVC